MSKGHHAVRFCKDCRCNVPQRWGNPLIRLILKGHLITDNCFTASSYTQTSCCNRTQWACNITNLESCHWFEPLEFCPGQTRERLSSIQMCHFKCPNTIWDHFIWSYWVTASTKEIKPIVMESHPLHLNRACWIWGHLVLSPHICAKVQCLSRAQPVHTPEASHMTADRMAYRCLQ